MSIKDELNAELRDAMRSRDRPRTNVIRQIETEVTMARTAPGFEGPVDDELYVGIIGSYVKKMAKARAEFQKAGERGAAEADKLTFEIDYLARWLPDKLSDEDTRTLVRSTIEELGASDVAATGRVIGAVMRSGAEVDGALVNRLVREELGA